ncbi:MAG: BmrU protein [Clostridia bacterium]|nr:BmrU protein [Clostridia bacterium]
MKHLFLINPASGKRGSTDALVRRIHDAFDRRGDDLQIVFTEERVHAEHLARKACETGENLRIYACGGDGTLNEAVNGAAGYPNAAVTNVPKGTGNDFLKIFGPKNVGRFTDLAALADGPQAAMDLMDCNGKLGIDIVCAGLDARVADDVDRYKGIPMVTGSGAYIMSLVSNVLFKGITRPIKITMGDRVLNEEISIICVCNGRYYGGGFMPVGDAEPDDGILDMLVVPAVDRRTLARLVGKYSKGKYKECPDHIYDYHGTEISYSSDRELVTVVDGEVMRGRSFTVRLSEKKVNFFYPADLTYHVKSGTLAAAL